MSRDPHLPRNTVPFEVTPTSWERKDRSIKEEDLMNLGKRMWMIVMTVVTVLAVVQLPAQAHHREGHQGGGGSTSPSPSPSPSPTAEPEPEPGAEPAAPCAGTGSSVTAPSTFEVTCTAVSDDGTLDVTGIVGSSQIVWVDYSWCIGFCMPVQVSTSYSGGATFSVSVDAGAGPRAVCGGYATANTAGACTGTIQVPAGVPVTCVMKVEAGWEAIGKLACS